MSKALYRRYRPSDFQSVIGQEQVTTTLTNAIASGKISHAYIFVGPRGTGKTSVARIFAHAINGFDYRLEDNCVDIIEIDAASNTGVDNIRELTEKAALAPLQGKYKVYIIDEVHMLSKAAFNAFLKTLEEPPAHCVFIMATTDIDRIPATIKSRSQLFTFKLANQSVMLKHLQVICQKEHIDIDPEGLKLIYKHGGGSFRDTLSLLDQISHLKSGKITASDISFALGTPKDAQMQQLLDAYQAQDYDAIRKLLSDLYDQGVYANAIAQNLIAKIVDENLRAHFQLLPGLIDLCQPHVNFLDVKLLLLLAPSPKTQPSPLVEPPVKLASAAPSPAAKTQNLAQPKTISNATNPAKHNPAPSQSAPATTTPSAETYWQKILQNVKSEAPTILSMLDTASYHDDGKTFTIYLERSFYQKKLDSKKSLILSVLPSNYNLKLALSADQDPVLSNISSIMGGGEEIKIEWYN